MPELVIKYKNKKTLEALLSIAKYFDFSVILPEPKDKSSKITEINGVPVTMGDPTIDISDLQEIFTGRNLDARQLRKDSWRKK